MTPRQRAPSSRVIRVRLGLALAGAAALLACGRMRESKTLRIAWTTDVLSLDPNEKFETVTDTYAMNVFEPLLRYDRQMSFAPALATHWDIPDGRTWRFHLRPGVRFQDGTLLSADDVVFSIERARKRTSSDLYPYLSAVSEVRRVDAETVEVISNRPAGLLSILSFVYILPKQLVLSRGEKAFFENPSGTGPYRFAGHRPGESLTLERWDGYWGGAASFPRVVFVQVKEPEQMWQVGEKSPPAILISPPRASWHARKDDSRFRLVSRPGMSVEYLQANLDEKPGNPLREPAVRRAIRAAIDYPRLLEKISGGESFPASQYVTPDVVGYNPGLTVPPFVPGLARRLLTEAGFPGGLSLTLNCSEGGTTTARDELVAELGAAGIKITPVPVSSEVYFERLNGCVGDLHLSGWICATGDASELFEGNFWRGGPKRTEPPCGYSRPDLDELIDRIARTLDPEARRDLLQQAMKRVVDDLPWIPLWVSHDRYAVSPSLVFEPRADGEIFLPDVRWR